MASLVGGTYAGDHEIVADVVVDDSVDIKL
jgi:hypothetical protein